MQQRQNSTVPTCLLCIFALKRYKVINMVQISFICLCFCHKPGGITLLISYGKGEPYTHNADISNTKIPLLKRF